MSLGQRVPAKPGPRPFTAEQRRVAFMAKVEPEPLSGCWLWAAAMFPNGYGAFGAGHERYAHRYSWFIFRGEIPAGLEIDHLCRIRSCVNPDHLRVVTHRENALAPGALSPAAQNARKTHCLRGHDLARHVSKAPSRTSHGRTCATCLKTYMREYEKQRAPRSRSKRRRSA